jgi:peptide/nickel transport system permease protein
MTRLRGTLRLFTGNWRALVGGLILLFFLLMATVGPQLFPLDMRPDFTKRFQWPSLEHPLGTDYAGRDVLTQIVHGSRDVLAVAALAGLFTTIIAVVVGMLAGLAGRTLDAFLMLLTNVVLSVPSFPVILVIAAMLQVEDPVTLALVLSVWAWGGLARAVRSQVLSLKERPFVEAAQLLGLGTGHVLWRELFPNVLPYVFIHFILITRGAIVASVALMLLGLVPFSPTNWGMMLNLAVFVSGAIYAPQALFYLLGPILAIMLFQLGALFFAHGLDEVFNPRLRAHE